ncbi:terminase large subunit domain-containing protein [Lactiplantibacillus daowaiensis]|uniref:Terminase large subunit domain-containing protein n=1 Tax=Lactiplantibacillus daowaiensis TaxID=2559918 RepID=A0ABW1RXY4_9LACO|nr:terminase family protein [Lactiplantibacillus daowaiensis]
MMGMRVIRIAVKLDKLFNPKQMQVIKQELTSQEWKLMINYGAVRSGKTFVDNFVFLFEVRHAAEVAKRLKIAEPLYILAGVSSKSIYNNILVELRNTFGLTFKFDKHNSFAVKFSGLPPVTVVQAFTGSIAGLGSVRGMTAMGAYVNEISMANEEVFVEIRHRCSRPGARVVGDTNPDIPTHWLKTKYIDDDSPRIISNHFTIDDNPRLDPDYVASLKETTPSGMFYERAINGEWTAGEGLVYGDFDKNKNIITDEAFHERTKDKRLHYYASVDFGFEHKGVMAVHADDEDGNTYLVKVVTKQFKQIEYWSEIANQICKEFGRGIAFHCDSARPDHVAHLQDDGFNADNAFKGRLSGIEIIAGKIKARHYLVLKSVADDADNHFLDELYQYVWDKATGLPVKLNDDVMDTVRYGVATEVMNVRNDAINPEPDYEEQNTYLVDEGLVDPDDPWI